MNLTNKQNVLIIGSGANALAFSDHCRNTGVTFYVLGSKDRKQEFIKAGAKDYYAYQDSGVYETIKSSGIKFDAIIDAIGKSNTVNKVINLLINNGTIAIYGLDHYLDYNIDKTLAPKNFTKLLAEDYDESSVHDDIVNFIKEGKLNAWDYISKEHIYPLEQARDALIATKERKVLKSVITP